jgi:hypothetical protein
LDLNLYLRVLWRFRVVVISGITLAVALALLAHVRVSSSGVVYRQAEVYQASTTLLVTGEDDPWFRSRLKEPSLDPETGEVIKGSSDPEWLTVVGFVYSQFAVSDEVRRIMERDGPVPGSVVASPLDPDSSLPVLSITALAASPETAVQLARRGTKAFEQFLEQKQDERRIPRAERVDLETITQANGAVLVEGRKLTKPIVIFLTVMMATLGLVFVLENLRPRMSQLPSSDEQERVARERARRTA